MKRSRVWLLLALLLAIALVTSGCFQIRMFKLSKTSLAAGETVSVRVETYPVSMSATDTQTGYFFLLIGMDNIEFKTASSIDLDGNWGGPYGKGSSNALRNLLLTDGMCDANGIDAQDMEGSYTTWRVVVSTAEFGPEGATAAQVNLRNRLNVLFDAPAGVGDLDRGDVVIFSGVWDDGLFGGTDGVPEVGEIACTGMVSFSVPYTD